MRAAIDTLRVKVVHDDPKHAVPRPPLATTAASAPGTGCRVSKPRSRALIHLCSSGRICMETSLINLVVLPFVQIDCLWLWGPASQGDAGAFTRSAGWLTRLGHMKQTQERVATCLQRTAHVSYGRAVLEKEVLCLLACIRLITSQDDEMFFYRSKTQIIRFGHGKVRGEPSNGNVANIFRVLNPTTLQEVGVAKATRPAAWFQSCQLTRTYRVADRQAVRLTGLCAEN
jgi:hypothetical protein